MGLGIFFPASQLHFCMQPLYQKLNSFLKFNIQQLISCFYSYLNRIKILIIQPPCCGKTTHLSNFYNTR